MNGNDIQDGSKMESITKGYPQSTNFWGLGKTCG
jgi:hypothetical protein